MARFAVLVAIILGNWACANAANAEISIDTSRIVLSTGQKTAEITVFNSSQQGYLVQARWTHLRQGANGMLYPSSNFTAPADFNAVGVYPARVQVASQGTAKIRLLLPPGPIANGEAIQHLRLDMDPEYGTGTQYAFVLPVFVRGTVLSPDVAITSTQLQGGERLTVRMENRQGATPHGHLSVFDSHGTEVARMNNVNIYRKQAAVDFTLKLPAVHGASLHVRYDGDAEYAGTVFATANIRP